MLPTIQEPILGRIPEVAFAAAGNNNGYLPTHKQKFCQPLSGDYQADLLNSRTTRNFNDRTGARCGSNTKPFLLQTYKRDSGEIMRDLSVPIYVVRRRLGRFKSGFKIGYVANS